MPGAGMPEVGPWAAPRGAAPGFYAALDLGTNNCRLLVAAPAGAGFRVVDSFSRIVRLGEGLQATGRLGQPAMDRVIDALQICVARMARRPMRGIRAVATEACRQAMNGREFLARVHAEVGLAFEIISPREEALLALESCAPLLKPTARRALLFDIGGGSTELAWVRLDTPDRQPELIGYASLPVGVVTLAERHGPAAFTEAGFAAMADEVIQSLAAFERVHCIGHEVRLGGVQVLGASGTVTTLAGAALNLARYRRPLVDGVTLSADDTDRALALLRGLGPDGLARHPCVGPDRADFVLPGCAVFQAMRDTWPMAEVTVADRGLREGMLLRMMRQRPLSPAARNRRAPAAARIPA
jgi:exopolyphosphatase/guanosine-5'-triphosphate,3'-diphosphate pyrophosphatase